ncbi:hypothetical protein RQP54_16820 [Curvibacter sp. APW13]|uniref:hypothetical protein n=1 Tax=Curvibacter sp. APW13 TaxID=3077236 RepID=UPI0028E08275|nr:hypothetical protein [Curvibacter sp. APW13]MDT8992536.1 hypothetical protein [Curvibacter sp. APW13]
MDPKNHFTTRRGFIAASGFGGLSLYGLWAAYGAAPGPLALLGLDHTPASTEAAHAEHGGAAAPASGGHPGHGAAATGPSAQEFSRMTEEFVERYRLPDGSVYPRRLAAGTLPAADAHAGHAMATDPHADHALPATADPHAGRSASPAGATATPDSHAGHAGHGGEASTTASADKSQPIDVLMTAGRWYYLPNTLRLDAGQAYRFRMMAVDIAHGASIQLGQGGRMMRLQPGRITEAALTFQKRGRYLMVCSVYCGEAHQLMRATIEVL